MDSFFYYCIKQAVCLVINTYLVETQMLESDAISSKYLYHASLTLAFNTAFFPCHLSLLLVVHLRSAGLVLPLILIVQEAIDKPRVPGRSFDCVPTADLSCLGY